MRLKTLNAMVIMLFLGAFSLATCGCGALIGREMAKAMMQSSGNMYTPVTSEVWDGVETVRVVDGGCICTTMKPEFGRTIADAWSGGKPSSELMTALVDELSAVAPFKVLTGKTSDEKNRAEKRITAGLELSYKGRNPRIILVANWMVISVDDEQYADEKAVMERMKGQDFDAIKWQQGQSQPKYVGGYCRMETAHHSLDEWKANNGKLIRSEMRRMIAALAVKAASALVPTEEVSKQ